METPSLLLRKLPKNWRRNWRKILRYFLLSHITRKKTDYFFNPNPILNQFLYKTPKNINPSKEKKNIFNLNTNLSTPVFLYSMPEQHPLLYIITFFIDVFSSCLPFHHLPVPSPSKFVIWFTLTSNSQKKQTFRSQILIFINKKINKNKMKKKEKKISQAVGQQCLGLYNILSTLL